MRGQPDESQPSTNDGSQKPASRPSPSAEMAASPTAGSPAAETTKQQNDERQHVPGMDLGPDTPQTKRDSPDAGITDAPPPRPGSGDKGSDSTAPQPGIVSKALTKQADKADLAGSTVGAKNTGQFLRKSSSDGSVKGDAKEVAAGAKTGAKIGSAIAGPVGTAVGGAVGGTIQGLKSKNGRVAIGIVGAGLVSAPFVAVFALIFMVTSLFGGTSGGFGTQDEGTRIEAMQTDGVDYGTQGVINESATNSGVAPEVLQAIAHEFNVQVGESAGAAEPAANENGDTESARVPGPALDLPVGPYRLLPVTANRLRADLDLDPLTDDEIAGFDDPQRATDFVAQTLREQLDRLVSESPTLSRLVQSYSLDKGVIMSESQENSGQSDRYIYGNDPSGNNLGFVPAQEAEAAEETLPNAGVVLPTLAVDDWLGTRMSDDMVGAEHIRTRELYLAALKTMPFERAEERAEDTFDKAMLWHLGRRATCNTNVTGIVNDGSWANPAVGSFSSRYGPRILSFTSSTFHMGEDIAAPAGSPAYAAGAGVVTITHASWSGTNNLVVIDHGGGIQTKYAHMQTVLVTDGQQVSAGTQVGEIGSEGNSSGPHLHFEVWKNGSHTAPVPFMEARGVNLSVDDPTRPVGSGSFTQSPTPTYEDADGTPISNPTSPGDTGVVPDGWTGTSGTGEIIALDATQLGFAAQIASTAKAAGAPDTAVVIAFMTVLVEGKFKNYASTQYPATVTDSRVYPANTVGSDADSVGLFQQRPSQGWGPNVVTIATATAEQRNADALQLLDVTTAAEAFFGGPSGPNAGSPQGLLDTPGWETMALGDAAQAVQRSAHPDRYANWEQAALSLFQAVQGRVPADSAVACPDGYAGDGSGGFRLTTFNLLGWGHTAPGGNRASWPDGDVRMTKAFDILDQYGTSVAALQEVHGQNATYFDANFADEWGSELRVQDMIIWRKTEWRKLESAVIEIPYFHGLPRRQPFVKLEHIASGAQYWFMGIHNPANTAGDATHLRAQAVRNEITAITEKKADGTPVIIAGDFNDWDYPHCSFTGIGMTNAAGPGTASPCKQPRGAGIDMIFATTGTVMNGYLKDWAPKEDQVTDHPVVSVTVGGGATEQANRAVAWALAQVGKGYSQDRRMEPNFFDCSSLVYRAYLAAGVDMGGAQTTESQQGYGQSISRSELQPGDLIFYPGHVSIYIGVVDGVPKMVHASNPERGVVVDPVSHMAGQESGNYRRVVTGSR